MNKYLPLVAALVLSSSTVAAQSFEDVFNAQRALHGNGHAFTFEGEQYTTDHPEELEAAAPANATNAKALIASAKAMHAEVKAVGYDWTLTKGILKNASKALKAGDFQKAMNLAAQAKYHARMGVAQYHNSKQSWLNMVPE
ncbi:MAG: hypothetical protein GY881_02275 [Gammaproteobacteria bacterium]|mgnify:CR=1 FL=1|jgi:hypothetical protein|nr:hypothetical protein [Gammaproteobacteria bacterium]MCP4879836.1 hypothetical protein [Gammaproteobacteria bacterium]MDP6166751.1 hypothetical protein [Gammaproteobacteria bacterium]